MLTQTSTSDITMTLLECTSLEDMTVQDNGDVVFDFFHPELDNNDKGVSVVMHSDYLSCTDLSSLPSHVENVTQFYKDELMSNEIQMELTIVNY